MTPLVCKDRLTSLFSAAVVVVALSACSSSSTPDAESNVDTGGNGVGQEEAGQEGTDQSGIDQGVTDGLTTVFQPNILLVITDDQGIDASAQYSVSNDVPNLSLIHI